MTTAPSIRAKSLTTKVTEEEYARLQEIAIAAGQSMGEWARTVLLAQVNSSQQIILAEILALRMLYLNTVQILGQKGELTTEKLRELIERVDREKQRKAQDRLSGQNGNQPALEKSADGSAIDRTENGGTAGIRELSDSGEKEVQQ
jgi:hypothetical protein